MKKYEYSIIAVAVIAMIFLPIWLGLIVLAICFGAAFWVRSIKKQSIKNTPKSK